MKVLFDTGMAFQFRSLLPVMKALIEKDFHVYVLRRGYFLERKIRQKPRSFTDVTKASLRFIARQSGLDEDFLDNVHFAVSSKRFQFPPSHYYHKFNMFISTTKGFPWLNQIAKFGKPRIAIGYQNLLGTYYTKGYEMFPQKCPPDLDFEQRIRQKTKIEWKETGLPFLDTYVERYRRVGKKKTNNILFLHPGGYRDIITRKNANKKESYQKQINFYERILNSIPAGMSLSVKLHPLAARYHDRKAQVEILKNFKFQIIEGFLGDMLFNFDAVLTVGSSALFEILPFGIPLFILGFLSRERTRYYKDMESLFVKTEAELYEKLKNCEQVSFKTHFEKDFFERLIKTTDGCATKRVLEIIENCV